MRRFPGCSWNTSAPACHIGPCAACIFGMQGAGAGSALKTPVCKSCRRIKTDNYLQMDPGAVDVWQSPRKLGENGEVLAPSARHRNGSDSSILPWHGRHGLPRVISNHHHNQIQAAVSSTLFVFYYTLSDDLNPALYPTKKKAKGGRSQSVAWRKATHPNKAICFVDFLFY
jgi:hypothetical protein